jgi:hypothetical protein
MQKKTEETEKTHYEKPVLEIFGDMVELTHRVLS